MIPVAISYRNIEGSDRLRDYANDKIGDLEKYLPRQVRESAKATVMLQDDVSGREDNRFVCEVIITVHGERFVSKEGTVNIYAAIDIVEEKLKTQIHSYKDRSTMEPRRTRMMSRLMGRRRPEPEPTTPE